MPGSFIFDRYVTGKNFVGRKSEVGILSNLLTAGENVVIYEPPRTGKMSLLQQTFYNMRLSALKFGVVECGMLNVRSISDLMLRLGSALIGTTANTPEELSRSVADLLPDTHFVFDPEVYSSRGMILSLNWNLDDNDIEAVFRLPYKIGQLRNQKLYLVLTEFQNVMLTEDGDLICKILKNIFDSLTPEQRSCASFVFMGSQVNAMKDIFAERKLFYRTVEHLSISQIEPKDIIDHIVRGFLNTGKVLDRDLMLGVCSLFRCNIWYINHFASICDSITRGYIMEPILNESLNVLVAVHEPRFMEIMNGLTTFQVCLLRAILDGHTKFSSAEVIKRYNLNSSANVRRLKDALCKKEIVTFEGEDAIPVILDPLFEYWVRSRFFEMKG